MNKKERNQILRLTNDVGTLKGKVDQMDKNISANLTSLEKRVVAMHNSVKIKIRSQAEKIDVNEESIAQIKGRSAGIAFVVSLIVSVIGLGIAVYKSLFK